MAIMATLVVTGRLLLFCFSRIEGNALLKARLNPCIARQELDCGVFWVVRGPNYD